MDNITPPSRGERITAEWARRVTDAANRGRPTVGRPAPPRFMRFESPSEYAFKVVVNDDRDGYWICLPKGCLCYGKTEIDLAKGKEPARMLNYGVGTSPENVKVDGKFDHVFILEPDGGSITMGEENDLYCAVIDSTESEEDPSAPSTSGTASQDLPRGVIFVGLDNLDNLVEDGERAVGLFRIATIIVSSDETKIEQVARGGVTLGGGGSADDLGPFHISKRDDGSLAITNNYYQVGGFTNLISDTAVSCADGIIALVVDTAYDSAGDSARVETYGGIAALREAQKELDKIVIPLYVIAGGNVAVDLRRAPTTGIIEHFNAQTS